MTPEHEPPRRVVYNAAADADLVNIYAFTWSRWGERQADAYLEDLRRAVERIGEGAALSRRLEFRDDAIFATRQGRHLIIHREEGDAIRIVRVLHQSMDIEARLDEP